MITDIYHLGLVAMAIGGSILAIAYIIYALYIIFFAPDPGPYDED